MKITGRNIKRRLYGLKNIPSNIKRARYFRGHGVHSPYVYAIVRQVFMRTTLIEESKHELHDMLLARGVAKRRAIQLQNLMVHCGYQSYAIDCPMDAIKECDMVIATTEIPSDMLHQMALAACQAKITLCILSPTADSKRDKMCRKIVEEHLCTSVDNRAYLLIFNNHLPKQKFRL